MIHGGNATVHVRDVKGAIGSYGGMLGRKLRPALAAATIALAACATARGSEPTMEAREHETRRASASLYRIILPVSDLDAAAAFYGLVLEAEGVRVSGGRHYFDCGGIILACFDPRGDGDGYDPTPLPEWIYFAVDDVRAARSRCADAGATFEPGDVGGSPAGEVHRRPWGELSFYARDGFGNGISFVERGTEFTGRF